MTYSINLEIALGNVHVHESQLPTHTYYHGVRNISCSHGWDRDSGIITSGSTTFGYNTSLSAVNQNSISPDSESNNSGAMYFSVYPVSVGDTSISITFPSLDNTIFSSLISPEYEGCSNVCKLEIAWEIWVAQRSLISQLNRNKSFLGGQTR